MKNVRTSQGGFFDSHCTHAVVYISPVEMLLSMTVCNL